MYTENLLQLPYGAVYYRKSNPPREDWERDYRQAAADGYNIFRHWFMWSAIETAPGVYDWEDCDRQLELGERYGIKTVIAEMTTGVPEWIFSRYPEALCTDSDGRKAKSQMSVSCAVGGFYEGVCLDTRLGRELTENFLRELAKRYKGHPALLGYDVWNECNYSHGYCYCEDTKKVFRNWLKKKYKSLDVLKHEWGRYSLTSWDDIQPPPKMGLYTECSDWLLFRKQNAYQQMKWKTDVLRAEDPDCLIAAHGTAQSLENMALGGSDEWMAGSLVEVYGLTFVQTRKGNEPYKQWSALDLTRSGSRGKPFWHAESQGGHLWYQPQVFGRKREDGRITEPEDIRQWNLTSLAGGARGILCPRWRPLLDGPLFGAFGPYGMDGSVTPRSEMTARIAKWANAPEQKELLKAAPIRGEIGILILEESQTGTYLLSQFGSEDNYKAAVLGVYRAFFDLGYQPDFVQIDDIGRYNKLYLPIPIMMSEANARKLETWVARGGWLFSEGCPGYFDSQCHAGTVQPNLGLDKLFGVRETEVEFTQDLLETEQMEWGGYRLYGGEYLQKYDTKGAQAVLRDEKGNVFLTENHLGQGLAILAGTCLGLGYWDHAGEQKNIYRWIARKMELEPYAFCDNDQIYARIQQNGGEIYLWVINSSTLPQRSRIELEEKFRCSKIGKTYWKGGEMEIQGNELAVSIGGRDAVIVRLG